MQNPNQTIEKQSKNPHRTVTVEVDNKQVHIEPGAYTESELKDKFQIDPAKVLDQVVDGAIKPIENRKVQIDDRCEGEKFISHTPTGSWS